MLELFVVSFFAFGLGVVCFHAGKFSESIAKKYLKSRGLEICRGCDDALAHSSMGFCDPCQYFYDQEEVVRMEYERLEAAQ